MGSRNKKNEILRMLKANFNEYSSGEELSRRLEISRTAVWKHIKEIQQAGYMIEASSRKGYKLVQRPRVMNGFEIGNELGTEIIGKDVIFFDTIDSTNAYAKKIASEGAAEGTVVAAGSQTGGRGRLGRKWESPPGAGIYFSVILRPKLPPEEVQIITLAASAAVASAFYSLAGIRAGIKWPNDVLLDGKKVCGILTEMNSEMEQVNFIVLGIGINFSQEQEDFPAELSEKATSVQAYARQQDIDISELEKLDIIRAVLKELDGLYLLILQKRNKDIIKCWKDYDITIGKTIRVLSGDSEYTAFVEGITDDGKLLVVSQDGGKRQVQSGEVSIRGLLGYM